MTLNKALFLAAAMLVAQVAAACPASLDAVLKTAYRGSYPAPGLPAGDRGIVTQDGYYIAVPANVQCHVLPRKPDVTLMSVRRLNTNPIGPNAKLVDVLLLDNATGPVRDRFTASDFDAASEYPFAFVKLETDALNSPLGPPMFGVITSRSQEEREYLAHTMLLYTLDGDKLRHVGKRKVLTYGQYKSFPTRKTSCGDKQQVITTIKPLASMHNGHVDLEADARQVTFQCDLVDGKEVRTFPSQNATHTLEFDGKVYWTPSARRN